MLTHKIQLIIWTSVLILYLIIDYFFDTRISSLGYEIYFNLNHTTFIFLKISYVLAYSLIVCQILMLILYLRLNHKVDILLIIMFSGFILGIHSFLKEIYNQGRPYMMNQDIKTIECIEEFGKPSGHTMAIITYMFGFYKIEEYNFQDVSFKGLKITIYSFICILIAFSRVVLGVHTLGQIMLGSAFGICLNMIYYGYFHERCRMILKRYLTFQSNSKQPLHISTVVLFVTFLIMSLGADYYSKKYYLSHLEKYEKYQDAIIACNKENGNEDYEIGEYFLQGSTFHSYFGFFLVVGLLLGFVMYRGFYEEGLFEALLQQRTCLTSMTRMGLFALLYVVIIYYPLKISKGYQVIEQWIIINGLVSGLYVTMIFPIIMSMLKLEIHGDLQCATKNNLIIDYSHIANSQDYEIHEDV